MALPTYASTSLPYSPLVGTWQEPDPYLDPNQTEMEGGNIVLRAQPGDDVEHIQFDIRLTQSQYTTFKAFIKTTLSFGTSRFTMQVWMGAAFETRTVQFAKKYQAKDDPPGHVIISFDLWVYP